jgi:hypothetical protein
MIIRRLKGNDYMLASGISNNIYSLEKYYYIEGEDF